jgi:nitrite reductase (NADH) small subunit
VSELVGNVSDFEPERLYAVEVAGRAVLLVHSVDGRFHAVRDLCPHHGAPLSAGYLGGTRAGAREGYPVTRRGEIVRCPWHGWRFDVTTGCSLHDSAGTRIARYEVTVDGGKVFVETRPRVAPH